MQEWVWGLWMKKVLADGTLGVSSNDAFPEAVNASYCDGASSLSSAKDDLEEYYFE